MKWMGTASRASGSKICNPRPRRRGIEACAPDEKPAWKHTESDNAEIRPDHEGHFAGKEENGWYADSAREFCDIRTCGAHAALGLRWVILGQRPAPAAGDIGQHPPPGGLGGCCYSAATVFC